MKVYRLWHTFRLCMSQSAHARADYARKHGIYDAVGKNVFIMDRKVPLYAKLIRFHNNIGVASNVLFVPHDATHIVLNRCTRMDASQRVQEIIGCIEVMDNVFIGSNTTVLSDVRIGPNAIVAAGSVVNRDVPPGSVVGGVPAKVIGDFDAYIEKRRRQLYPQNLGPSRQKISARLVNHLWSKFAEDRSNGAST